MTKREKILTALTVMLAGAAPALAGVSGPRTAQNTLECTNASNCVVTVTVEGCYPNGATVSHDFVHLRRGNSNIPITWKLSPNSLPGVTFATDGVRFYNDRGQFPRTGPNAARTEYKYVGVNSVPGEYFYIVKLVRGALDCATVDPYVVNE